MSKKIDLTTDGINRIEKITRVEVIDKKGRSYTKYCLKNAVEISIQDDGRTLKIFINEK